MYQLPCFLFRDVLENSLDFSHLHVKGIAFLLRNR